MIDITTAISDRFVGKTLRGGASVSGIAKNGGLILASLISVRVDQWVPFSANSAIIASYVGRTSKESALIKSFSTSTFAATVTITVRKDAWLPFSASPTLTDKFLEASLASRTVIKTVGMYWA